MKNFMNPTNLKMKFTMPILAASTLLSIGANASASGKVFCAQHLNGQFVAQGYVQLSGLKGSATLSNGSRVSVEVKNQCSTMCTIQKVITVEILEASLSATNTYTYVQSPGNGRVEYPLISGKINGQDFDTYCADQ